MCLGGIITSWPEDFSIRLSDTGAGGPTANLRMRYFMWNYTALLKGRRPRRTNEVNLEWVFNHRGYALIHLYSFPGTFPRTPQLEACE